jgi:hypoxanthine phosphoribosyltransferase
MEKIYLSWDEIEDAIESLAHQIKQSGKKIGSMDGLARGGLIPAVMLSHKLGIPFMNENNNDEGYILIVDDICDTGETLEYYDIHDYILTATIHHKQTAIVKPDFYYSLAPQDKWIVYPWEQKDSKTIQDYKDSK